LYVLEIYCTNTESIKICLITQLLEVLDFMGTLFVLFLWKQGSHDPVCVGCVYLHSPPVTFFWACCLVWTIVTDKDLKETELSKKLWFQVL